MKVPLRRDHSTGIAPGQVAAFPRLPAQGSCVLRTFGLTKRFGELTAVDGLNLEVQAGQVHGFLGPNGSGKSTTVGMILGLIAPTAGRIEVAGEPRRSVGAIVESPAFYPHLSGRDNLRALAIAVGDIPTARIDSLLEDVGLAERSRGAYHTYSMGMKQRLGIAATLLTDPALVILDEPTNGLDPAGQAEIRELIPRLAHEGRGILLASHLLNEVQHVCDEVTIIRRGRLIETGRVRDLLKRGGYIAVEVAGATEARSLLLELPAIERVDVIDDTLHVYADAHRGPEITRQLASHGLYLASMTKHESTLEEVFLGLTGEVAGEASPREGASVAAAS
jgi:ABC-2 type transport system ATP-binding protein